MRKLLLTAVASLACVAAFAQGRINFVNDSLHLVYYDPDPQVAPFPGLGLDSAHMPNGITLVADLYIGTNSSSLSFISSTTFSGTPGKWNALSVQVPGIPGGTSVFVMAQIRDSSFPPEPVWGGIFYSSGVWAASQEFAFVLGTSNLGYPAMYAKGPILGGGFSTWADGMYPMDYLSAGFRGAIVIGIIPEPTSFTLAALGAAAMLIFRRRK